MQDNKESDLEAEFDEGISAPLAEKEFSDRDSDSSFEQHCFLGNDPANSSANQVPPSMAEMGFRP